jgi:hypothetical protein
MGQQENKINPVQQTIDHKFIRYITPAPIHDRKLPVIGPWIRQMTEMDYEPFKPDLVRCPAIV